VRYNMLQQSPIIPTIGPTNGKAMPDYNPKAGMAVCPTVIGPAVASAGRSPRSRVSATADGPGSGIGLAWPMRVESAWWRAGGT
jgi:hypothetical protein